MLLSSFLAALRSGLEHGRVGTRALRVVYAPQRAAPAGVGEVLVGVGRWGDTDEPADHQGLCLQNKGLARDDGQRYATVTELALEAPPVLGPGIRPWAGQDDAEGAVTLFVEDCSPDSVFAVLVVLARWHGVTPDKIPPAWVSHVRAWELGDVRSTVVTPETSWGVLQSTLAHDMFGVSDPDAAATRAWREALDMLAGLLALGVPPTAVPADAPLPAVRRARAHLRAEAQHYQQALAQAEMLQLLVPIAGSTSRRLLVDAFFGVEQSAQGASKVFLRSDREHTWLQDGFAVMGLFRPGSAGTGNDMVLSVDPATGIYLEDLWRALEALENERWGDARPSDAPRAISSYPDGGPNQPWWDDHGQYTLLGAPKRVGDELGSKLSWADVVQTAWRCYSPLTGLRFRVDDELFAPHRLPGNMLPAEPLSAQKRLVSASWERDASDKPALLLAPTLLRALAACVQERDEDDELTVQQLPDPNEYAYVELNGGFAIVTLDGALLLDDWHDRPLKEEALRVEFVRAATLVDHLTKARELLDLLVEEVGKLVRERGGAADEIALLDDLTALKASLRETHSRTRVASVDPDVRRFRAVLDERWGVASSLEDLYASAERMQETIRGYSDVRTNRLLRSITVWGFPFVLMAGFFSFLLEGLKAKTDEPVVNWGGVGLYLLLASGLGLAVLLLSRARRWRAARHRLVH